MLRLLLVLSAAQLIYSVEYFDCPPHEVLTTTLGDKNCSDHPDRGTSCGKAVEAFNQCTFTISTNDTTLSVAQLQVVATNVGFGDSITIQGVYDLVQSSSDTTFTFRGALPTSSNKRQPFVTITVYSSVNSNMTFGYYVQLNPLPALNNGHLVAVSPGRLAQFIQLLNANYSDYWEITADTQAVISPVVNPFTSPYDLTNLWLFEGFGGSRKIIGTLFSPPTPGIRPQGSQLTLQYVLASKDQLVGTVVVNDVGNLASCGNFYAVTWAPPSDFKIGAGADNVTGCWTVINEVIDGRPFYFMGAMNQFGNGTINAVKKIVAGGPVNDPDSVGNILGTYSDSAPFAPPQSFFGYARTFMFSGDQVTLSFSRSVTTGNPYTPYEGWNGFIATNNYPYQSNSQNGFFEAVLDHNFNLTFTIERCLSPTTVIKVQNQSTVLDEIFVANTTQKTFSYVDFLVTISVDQGYGTSGGGALLSYRSYDVFDSTTAAVATTNVVPNSASTAGGSTSSTMAPTTTAGSPATTPTATVPPSVPTTIQTSSTATMLPTTTTSQSTVAFEGIPLLLVVLSMLL